MFDRKLSMSKGLLVKWSLIVIVVVTLSSSAFCDDRPLSRALDAWKKKRESISAVRYKVEAEITILAGSRSGQDPTARFPLTDHVYIRSHDYILNIKSGSFRSAMDDQIWDTQLESFRPKHFIDLYDGQQFQRYVPKSENTSEKWDLSEIEPELFSTTSSIDPYRIDLSIAPIWFAHGMVVPTSYKEFPADFLREGGVDESMLSYQGTRDDGIIMARVSANLGRSFTDEYAIDPDKDFSIVEWSRVSDEKVHEFSDIHYEKKEGVWIPISWVLEMDYARKTSSTIRVVDYEVPSDIEGIDFSKKPRPNSVMVRDGDFYKVGGDGKAEKTSVGRLVYEQNRWKRIVVIVVVVLSVLIVLVELVLIARRYHRRSTEKQSIE